MSTAEAWLSIVGSIASIGAAIWAFLEARKSSSSAQEAKRLVGEIVDRRKLIEVSRIHAETSKVISKVAAVGPSASPELLRGLDCVFIAQDVEEYVRFLNEHSSLFDDELKGNAESLCGNIYPDIEALSEAVTSKEKKRHGSSIYYNLNSFLPLVKRLSDERKENVD